MDLAYVENFLLVPGYEERIFDDSENLRKHPVSTSGKYFKR
jgi:hypothetical protein